MKPARSQSICLPALKSSFPPPKSFHSQILPTWAKSTADIRGTPSRRLPELPSEPGLKAPANSVTDEPAIAKLKVAEQISPRADRENEAGPAQFAPRGNAFCPA